MTNPFSNSSADSGRSPFDGPFPGSSPFGTGGPAPSNIAAPLHGETADAPMSSPVSGPWVYVNLALTTAVIGIIIGIAAPLTGSPTDGSFHILAIAGWVLAGLATVILLGLHSGEDNRRRAENLYIGTPRQTTVFRTAGITAVIGVLITAVEIALWISKTVGA